MSKKSKKSTSKKKPVRLLYMAQYLKQFHQDFNTKDTEPKQLTRMMIEDANEVMRDVKKQASLRDTGLVDSSGKKIIAKHKPALTAKKNPGKVKTVKNSESDATKDSEKPS